MVVPSTVEGVFRVRRHENGDAELWARGWRLEVRFLSLVPALLAVGFAMSTIFLPVRLLGCAGLLGAAFVLHRLTGIGIRMGVQGLTLNDLLRSRQVPWSEVSAFMGERTRHDGRLVLMRQDGSTVVAPGALTGEDLNPIGDEGDLSVVEELNRMMQRYRGGLPLGVPSVDPAPAVARPRRRAKGPSTRPRAVEPRPTVAPAATLETPEPESRGSVAPAAQSPIRHPHVPRPPQPEPEPEPTRRGLRQARRARRRGGGSQLIRVPEADLSSPGARLLASLDERRDRG